MILSSVCLSARAIISQSEGKEMPIDRERKTNYPRRVAEETSRHLGWRRGGGGGGGGGGEDLKDRTRALALCLSDKEKT